MKKIAIIFLLIIAKCNALFSQENLVVFFTDAITNGVLVYSSDTSNDSVAIINEDSEKENWHDVEILGQLNNRYRVRIIAINENNIEPIYGWVDKEQCGVWLHSRYIQPDLFVVSLYDYPGQSIPYMTLKSQNCYDFEKYSNTNSGAVPVLDYKLCDGKYWIKTLVINDGRIYIGWTTNYCPNPYDSCN
jgi:hypothetical protein